MATKQEYLKSIHMIRKIVFFTFLQVVFVSQAQDEKILDSINIYGKLRVHASVFDGTLELQENSPRVGTSLSRNLDNGFQAFGQLELGVHIIEGTEFNNDASTSSEFIKDPFKERDAITSRLAILGIRHAKYGSISFGKQWGAYYDIAAYTDNFVVFGGSASGTYAGNSDGGWKGTGRANKSVLYRNNFNNFSLAVQSQLIGGSHNYGASIQYKTPINLLIGAAYNSAEIREEYRNFITDIGPNSSNFIFGLKYAKNKIGAALTYSLHDDEFIQLDESTVISFPTYGLESLISYQHSNKLTVQAGFNYMKETSKNSYFNTEYKLMHYILDINYYLDDYVKIYMSGRIDDSKSVLDTRTHNVFLVGFSYEFNFNNI
jgi:predicted porin